MKMRIGLVGLLVAGMASAQTNLITFTNRSHEVISNATVLRCDGVRLIYRTEGAGGGSVKLVDLPSALQERFGYDPDKAAKVDQKEQAAKRREAAAEVAAIENRASAAKLQAICKKRTIVFGKIIQRTEGKLLVNTGNEVEPSGIEKQSHGLAIHEMAIRYGLPREWQNGVPEQWAEAHGTVLLVDHPKIDLLVDGDLILILAWPDGNYEYTSVSGGRKTVRKYTASVVTALLNSQ